MAQADTGTPTIDTPILELLMREKAKALSPREWRFRLAGYGYAIKDVAGAKMVTKLPQGDELGYLPAQLI
jgi:hypothetical protein